MPKKKKQKKINTMSKVIYIIYLLISLITMGIILFLNILPLKYILIILSLYAFISLIFSIFIFNNRIKKKIKTVIDIICIIFIVIFSLVLNYLNKTLNFMELIKYGGYQIEEYYVLVLEDSGYYNVNQLVNVEIGIYSDDTNYIKALDELKQTLNFNEHKYNDYVSSANNLLKNNVEAIFISAAHKSILDEQITDFENDTKILEKISIKVKSDIDVDDIDITKESFNVYISGIDIYGDISLVSRSDVNMIATVNPVTHEILLTSIPRDYYVQLHGTNGYKDKLTHAGLYGINMSVTTLEDLLHIDIDYYIRVNFTTLINMVDAIGGINVYSDLAFTTYNNKNCKIVEGNNYLNGKCALAFARERYAYKEGDRHRVQNQQDILTAILNKTLSSKVLITKYTKILESLGSSFQTNIPQDNIYSLVNMQLDKMPKWTINSISLNGYDSHNYTYSYSANKLYVMEPNMKTVTSAALKIKELEESE